jgi:hypothetical protein
MSLILILHDRKGTEMPSKEVTNAARIRTTDTVILRGIRSNEGDRIPRLRIAGLVVMLMLVAAPIVHAGSIVIFSDPFTGSGGDYLYRGFYLSNYPGTNLSTVTVAYSSFTAGECTTSMTARLGAYDGPIIGSTQTINVNLAEGIDHETLATYDFGGALVPAGSIVTFTQQLLTGSVYYDVGVPGVPGITQTEGTMPPLDTFRRNSVGVIVTQLETVPEPSTMLLLGSGLLGLAGLRKKLKK